MSHSSKNQRARAAAGAALLAGLASWGGALRAEEAPIDLDALLAEAEAQHPELALLAARREVAAAIPSQVETMPDPLVTVSYTNEGFDSFTLGEAPEASLAFTWTQDVPYPGKRDLARGLAQSESTVAEREIDVARVRIRSEVKRLYFDLYRIDREREALEDTRKVLAGLIGTARARYESGEGTLESVLKAQTETTAIDTELAGNRESRRRAEIDLAAAVGRAADSRFGPARELPPIVPPDRAAVEAQALSASPEIRALQASADAAALRVGVAQKNLKPDLVYGFAYWNRGGLDPKVMGMFGVRLPISRARKQSQAIVQSEHERDAADRSLDLSKIEVAQRVRELFASFDRANTLAPLYADGLIPQSRSTLDAAAASYAAGRTDFLALFDDAMKVLRYEIEYARQRAGALQALAGLEAITGMELIVPPPAAVAALPPGTGGFHE